MNSRTAFLQLADTEASEETMGGWGCPHEVNGKCQRVNNIPCDPGMKGCVLFGRFVFSNEAKNRPGGPRSRKREPEPKK